MLTADKQNVIAEMSEERLDYDKILAEMDQDTSIPEQAKERIIREVLNGRWFSGKLDQYYGNESLWLK
ncbi:hypothetical protein [Gracilibacillus sp. JCM 18860]|uniref:hypothetical protein n=1 Tax=Gracilibacillus sp. JCM 18860 TaxID=1306159 RepID=UPI0006CFE5C8